MMPVIHFSVAAAAMLLGANELPVPAKAPSDAAWFSVKAFGARGDGRTNDTAGIRAALEAAQAAGGVLFFPGGTYLTETITLRAGAVVRGSGKLNSVLRPINGCTVLDVSRPRRDTHGYAIEISDLKIQGDTSGTGHGVYSSNENDGVTQLALRNLWIADVGGSGVRLEANWSVLLEGVTVDRSGDHNFFLQGKITTTFLNCYAKRTARGKAGYRILEGHVVLIGANGIDPPSPQADWGVFGQSKADGDAEDTRASVTLIGCNVEDFTRYGLWVKKGSNIRLFSSSIVAPSEGQVIAARFDSGLPGATWDEGNLVTSKGAKWVRGYPIHAKTPAPYLSLTRGSASSVWVEHENGPAQVPWLRIDPPTGTVNVSALTIGEAGGAAIKRVASGLLAWEARTLPPHAAADVRLQVPGALAGDPVAVGFTGGPPPGVIMTASIPEAGAARVVFVNALDLPVHVPSGTIRVDAWQH